MDKFAEELKKTGITLTERQREQFDRYYELLVERNKVMNLTGITDYDEVNLKHFTDSLTIVRLKDMSKRYTLHMTVTTRVHVRRFGRCLF